MAIKKIVSIIGARPQFIKAAPLSRAIAGQSILSPRPLHLKEVIIHTGQHYDDNMSAVFFKELGIPEPDRNLNVGSGTHGMQTGLMLTRIEEVLLNERPDQVLVYGDTNSTLAGALAASKLHIPVAHVEAGLRSFNRAMPEEINRVVTDHLSDLLICPSQTAVDNLLAEGITHGVHLVGDIMADALFDAARRAPSRSDILNRLVIEPGKYLLVTLHRSENTDNETRLSKIFAALDAIDEKIIFPVHPRTRKAIEGLNYSFSPNVRLIHPVGYLDMVTLEQSARMILTDSGGIQKEAYWLCVPCVTLRDETEWVETVQAGWNVTVGADTKQTVHQVRHFKIPQTHPPLYGDGNAVSRCLALLA
jgi:UDP-GlcNAc3NAcA epimerase